MTRIDAVRFATFAAMLLLTGCSHRVPTVTIEVVDTSMSIAPRAAQAVQAAIQQQIGHLGRGDRLILIPITGDAQNDAGGRMLRLTAPSEREGYDADLRRFQSESIKQYAGWSASLSSHETRTDILGALDAALQESVSSPNGMNRKIVIVSDFLEDDGNYRFVSDGSLASPERARQLALHLREQHGPTLKGVPICLGRLESIDFGPLPAQRKDAVQAFWKVYLGEAGEPVDIRFDGTGMLADTEGGCLAKK
jgi:hypothetical protein